MFTDRNISQTKGLRHLGYWRSRQDVPDDLPWPSDFIDPDWDPQELEAVAEHVAAGEMAQGYLGYACCRLCGERLGTTCVSDGTFVWPAKFEHYLREHKVKPPQEFIDHALKRTEAKKGKASRPGGVVAPIVYWIKSGLKVRCYWPGGLPHMGVKEGEEFLVGEIDARAILLHRDDGRKVPCGHLDFPALFEPLWVREGAQIKARGSFQLHPAEHIDKQKFDSPRNLHKGYPAQVVKLLDYTAHILFNDEVLFVGRDAIPMFFVEAS
jgi:hypothetical protein